MDKYEIIVRKTTDRMQSILIMDEIFYKILKAFEFRTVPRLYYIK